jgi:hypothetical protein
LKKEHVVKNIAEEVMQVVNFEKSDSVRMRLGEVAPGLVGVRKHAYIFHAIQTSSFGLVT